MIERKGTAEGAEGRRAILNTDHAGSLRSRRERRGMQSFESGSNTWRKRLTSSTATFLPVSITERITLILLLLLALALRFWGFPDIPYTHDEISALVRVDFPTLGDAISKGVWNIDTHPPGTHAFLWCWTQLFGFGDGAVKAPFILMSVVALFCLYRFAHAWAGGTVALIVIALLATMQYTVMYGQIARPYAMGFFTTALLADQLTRYIGTGRRLSLIVMAIATVLSAYTHHFALMLAAFMCGTGFFLIDRSHRKTYLIAMGVAVACYLPNLPLFFAQLGWKGLDEWLTAPAPDWTVDYLWWIGHCSVLFAGLLALLVLAAVGFRIKHRDASKPLLAIALIWGLLPLVVGYAYSALRSPVLQYSVVLFSFPYLLIGALAGLRHLKFMQGVAVACVASGVSLFTLDNVRQHYTVFNQSKYEAIVRGTEEAEGKGALAIVDLPPEVMEFYRKLWCIAPARAPFVNLRYRAVSVLDSVLRASKASSIFYGQTTQAEPENVAKVQARFPFLIERHDRYEGQTFIFAARPDAGALDDITISQVKTPEALQAEGWEVDAGIPLVNDTTVASYGGLAPERWDFTGYEYGALYDGPVDELARGPNDVIEVRADITSADPASDMSLVVELKDGDSTRFYRASQMSDALRSGNNITLIAAVKLADMPGHGKGLRLRTYLYNPARKKALISSLGLRVREGNPVLYGLFQPIAGNWKYR